MNAACVCSRPMIGRPQAAVGRPSCLAAVWTKRHLPRRPRPSMLADPCPSRPASPPDALGRRGPCVSVRTSSSTVSLREALLNLVESWRADPCSPLPLLTSASPPSSLTPLLNTHRSRCRRYLSSLSTFSPSRSAGRHACQRPSPPGCVRLAHHILTRRPPAAPQ